MKIFHVPFCYYPDKVGGTEIYVQALCRDLNKIGVECVIVAPGDQSKSYQWEGVEVRRIAVSSEIGDLEEMYGPGDDLAAREFEKILEEIKPDLVHIHAHTRAISLKMVQTIKSRSIPVVFTYHTPTVTCHNGMLLCGKRACDGFMDPIRCTDCALQSKGLNKSFSSLISRLPNGAGSVIKKLGFKGKLATVLRFKDLVSLHQDVVRNFLASMDHIVAVCQWVEKVLFLNGVPKGKMTLCRQELTQTLSKESKVAMANTANRPIDGKTRLVFLGRLDPTKGVEILIRAFKLISNINIFLDIYGVGQGESGAKFEAQMRSLAQMDPRIQFKKPISSNLVLDTLKNYDALVVPSQWMETGPLVVLEAFAAGIPVIGSNLGGIRELVTDGVNGLLVEYCNDQAWFQAILKFQKLANNNPLKISDRISEDRISVSDQMISIYKRLMDKTV